jgi:hypothetical protein
MSPVTAESSQPAPQPAAPQSTGGQSSGNQSVRIAALVVLGLVIVGVVLYLIFGHSSSKKHNGKGGRSGIQTSAIGPWALTANRLKAEGLSIGQPVYWAGTRPAVRYEFWRTTNGRIFVRYLTKPNKAGAKGAKWLVVATYPWGQAYKALKKQAKGAGIKGPNGSIIWVRPTDPKSVLMAWPKVPYEVEIYDPRPAVALATARSGDVKTVG